MSLQEYFKWKEKLKETIKKKQIEDERAGASTHRQISNKWWVGISISNKSNDETLSTIYKYPFFHENQFFRGWSILLLQLWKTWGYPYPFMNVFFNFIFRSVLWDDNVLSSSN